MITLIEALNYRCLRYVSQPLGPFHILVGPNASGKSTFLDVVSFLGQLLEIGLEDTIRERASDPRDLLFGREGERFELAVEFAIPEQFSSTLLNDQWKIIRYEVAIGIDPDTGEPSILNEAVLLKDNDDRARTQQTLFPEEKKLPSTLLCGIHVPQKGWKRIVSKNSESGEDFFVSEVEKCDATQHEGRMQSEKSERKVLVFQLGNKRSAFANLVEDSEWFPVSIWLKDSLKYTIRKVILDSQQIRLASPPGQSKQFQDDGANLPWVLKGFKEKYPQKFRDWIAHLRTALTDLKDILIYERPDDHYCYIKLVYATNTEDIEVPSWLASDGTLRMLALTLLAYLPEADGLFLIEEPENGIHPLAVETMYQSLANVADAQILVASHSPVLLSMADPEQVLCFAKDHTGATDIINGKNHPRLVDWQKETSLGELFAAGVLG